MTKMMMMMNWASVLDSLNNLPPIQTIIINTNILNKYIKYINLGDPIAVLGFIDSVLGSVDL